MTFEYPIGATPLDPDELEGLKFPHVTTRGELDHLEQANIVEGLKWLDRYTDADILTEKFVLVLHQKLFGQIWNWAGQFRRTEKNIGVEPSQIAMQLRMLLDDVEYWIDNKTFPAEEIALRFHHRLVKIHLFANGNGRHARIMADALLTKMLGSQAIDWTRGSDLQTIGTRRAEYIRALRAADGGDYSMLLNFGRGK